MLSKEVRELKEKLLSEVEEIIERQNRVEPVNKVESFQVETASRRVLKDLTDEFYKTQGQQDRKIKDVTGQFEAHRRKVDSMEAIVKKLQVTITESLQHGRRLAIAVSKF